MQEAFEWYEVQQAALGYEFISEVEEAYKKICSHPLNYGSVSERFRRLKISRFPYLIIYEIEGSTIFINAVRHTHKKPKVV
jgi:hypothetical protein